MGLYYGDSFGWGFGGFIMGIVMFAFWFGLLFLIVWTIKELVTGGSRSKKEDSAMEILKERYAKGEIDKKEFEERKKALEN